MQKITVKSISCVLLLILLFSIGYSKPKPVFVMIERDPMFGTFRGWPPQFVLYADGTVIYWQSYKTRPKEGDGYQYYSTKLTSDEFIQLKTLLMDTNEISKLKKEYCLKKIVFGCMTVESIMTQEFAWFFDNGKVRSRYIYGQVENGFNPKFEELSFLYKIVTTIKGFKPQTRKIWMPEKIEVLFRPQPRSFVKPIAWPSKWPGLNDSSSIDRTLKSEKSLTSSKNEAIRSINYTRNIDETFPYSVFVPAKDYNELMVFLETIEYPGGILIDGKLMSATTYKPFPCEKMWQFLSKGNPIFESKLNVCKHIKNHDTVDDLIGP